MCERHKLGLQLSIALLPDKRSETQENSTPMIQIQAKTHNMNFVEKTKMSVFCILSRRRR